MHRHHSHSLSYHDEDTDENTFPSSTDASPTNDNDEPPSPSAFVSPPASSIRPPTHEGGLVPDAMDRVPYGSKGGRSSVGRFMIVEGSPSRGPLGGNEERPVSPIAQQQSPQPPSPPVVAPHSYPVNVPRIFYVPRFPSMSVNGESCTLTLGISVLPPHGISISPSASGLEFTPPKLKWTPSSVKKEASFTATPLPTAKEGKVKVCYIISGDDAADYVEPPNSSFQMYTEDTPLPLPSPPADALFSPTGSDASDSSSVGGSNAPRNDRAAFLASGVPRQSGRFMVIDEEMQQTNTPPLGSAGSNASFATSGSGGMDNPFDLLSRLQQTMQHLVETNARLQSENERLLQENAELRSRGGIDHAMPDNRFGAHTPTQQQQQSHHNGSGQQRAASIQQHSSSGASSSAGPLSKPRYATLTPTAANALSTNTTIARPMSLQVTHTSPPSHSAANTPRSNSTSQPAAHHPPIVMSADKRQTLPANFVLPRGSPSVVGRLPQSQSHPSTPAGPSLSPNPASAATNTGISPNASTAATQRRNPSLTGAPASTGGTTSTATNPSTQVSPSKRSSVPTGTSGTTAAAGNTPPKGTVSSSTTVSPSTKGRRKSMEFAQNISDNLTASLHESVKHPHQQR